MGEGIDGRRDRLDWGIAGDGEEVIKGDKNGYKIGTVLFFFFYSF